MRGPFDPSGPQPVFWRRATLWLIVAAVVFVYFIAGAIWGNAAVPWVLGGYLVIFMGVALREALRIGRREWEASLAFPLQTAPSVGLTPLEVEAIASLAQVTGIGRDLISHLSSAEVTLRWNTGSGCLVSLEGAGPALPDGNVQAGVAWFSLIGVPGLVGFRLWQTNGVVDLIEAFSEGYRTADVNWCTVAFTAADSPGAWPMGYRPEIGAWMKESLAQAAAEGLFEHGAVRLR